MSRVKRVLVTGGCGFIGHHFVEHVIKNTDWEVVIWDKLTYAAQGFDRLRDIQCFDEERVTVLTMDIAKGATVGLLNETRSVDYLVHMAAETHVDQSIRNAGPFVDSNVVGTWRVLECVLGDLRMKMKRVVYFSTDEVFGPAAPGVFHKEDDPYHCTNPYAASKAGGEQLALSYANCYQLPVLITHCMNVFGERQHPEKFIPMVLKKVLAGEEVTIHADATCTVPGSRFYIHARNVAAALLFLLDQDLRPGEKVNIVGQEEVDNLTLARLIAKVVGKDLKYKLVDFHSSRPGHDLRYALDGSKLAEMGWSIPAEFEESLIKTVEWFLEHRRWLGAEEEIPSAT